MDLAFVIFWSYIAVLLEIWLHTKINLIKYFTKVNLTPKKTMSDKLADFCRKVDLSWSYQDSEETKGGPKSVWLIQQIYHSDKRLPRASPQATSGCDMRMTGHTLGLEWAEEMDTKQQQNPGVTYTTGGASQRHNIIWQGCSGQNPVYTQRTTAVGGKFEGW